MYTLEQLNTASTEQALAMLEGTYEHSPWVAERALKERPFHSLAHLKHALVTALAKASRDEQLGLIRAHPELAGKAMVSKSLTAESTHEQHKAGLTACTPEEFARLQQLNTDYNTKFGFPFILAVRGPRGLGLNKQQIIETFARRLEGHPDVEREECLRNINRIAEIRLNDKFGFEPTLGNEVWDWHEALARHSDPGFAEKGQLTVTYLTEAHQACARQIAQGMRDCGFDEVFIDAVGNVVGRYHGATPEAAEPAPGRPKLASAPSGGSEPHAVGSVGARYLLTGSHFDTVRNGGKYDGRLGIFVPMACVRELHRAGRRLAHGIEVVAFAEEEGQRYKATFLASGALVGQFNAAWLEQKDADGIPMREAMAQAGLNPADIAGIRRDPGQYLGFVEVHIEQGPVLHELQLPLGVVTSINGSVRFLGELVGVACHAGTTPMDRRSDAVCGLAELALFMEKRARQDGDSVATIGQLNVPAGSINVVPGRCQFSLDLRAPTDTQRDVMVRDVLAELNAICQRRGLSLKLEETMRAAAAPSAPAWQARWEAAVQAQGLPVFRLPSGAGHDAMKLHELMPQAMLFVRGQNAGISHNPLEATTNDDMQLAVQAFMHLIEHAA